ncbi:hypothetical protein [Aurantimonas sp. VKM B-3413]|uniref:hypothetical protein n=1 Tax=Aurantimonas sp. VKM B-3413 TaxID=2779401 RepID=UPI001E5B4F85|nr:hypothetical protein [Aurantimonas sp. VKM B-3413]MCB8839234.1 hypothetical protein [Aurantimonas sp. VKM B-3413]
MPALLALTPAPAAAGPSEDAAAYIILGIEPGARNPHSPDRWESPRSGLFRLTIPGEGAQASGFLNVVKTYRKSDCRFVFEIFRSGGLGGSPDLRANLTVDLAKISHFQAAVSAGPDRSRLRRAATAEKGAFCLLEATGGGTEDPSYLSKCSAKGDVESVTGFLGNSFVPVIADRPVRQEEARLAAAERHLKRGHCVTDCCEAL